MLVLPYAHPYATGVPMGMESIATICGFTISAAAVVGGDAFFLQQQMINTTTTTMPRSATPPIAPPTMGPSISSASASPMGASGGDGDGVDIGVGRAEYAAQSHTESRLTLARIVSSCASETMTREHLAHALGLAKRV